MKIELKLSILKINQEKPTKFFNLYFEYKTNNYNIKYKLIKVKT